MFGLGCVLIRETLLDQGGDANLRTGPWQMQVMIGPETPSYLTYQRFVKMQA